MRSKIYRPIVVATVLALAIAGCQTAAPTLTHEGTVGNNVSKTQLGNGTASQGVPSQPMAISAAQGGQYVSSDGMISAKIPPGALSGDANVTITRGDTSMYPVDGALVPGVMFHVDLGGATLKPGQSIVVNCAVDSRFIDGVKAHDPNFTPQKYNLTQQNGVWYMAMGVTQNGPVASPNDTSTNGWALQEEGALPLPGYVIDKLADKPTSDQLAQYALLSTGTATSTPTPAPSPTPTPCATYQPVNIQNTLLIENAQQSLSPYNWSNAHEYTGWFTCHYGHTCGWGNVTNAIQEALANRAYNQLKGLKNSFCAGSANMAAVRSQAASFEGPLAGGPLAYNASSLNSPADLDNLIATFANWTNRNPVHDPCDGHTVTVKTHTTFVSDDASVNGTPVTDGPIYFANQNNLNWYLTATPNGSGNANSTEADGTPLELIPVSWVSGLHQYAQGPDVKVGVTFSPLSPANTVELTVTKNSPHININLTTDGAKLESTAHVKYTLDGTAMTADLPCTGAGTTTGSLFLKQDVNSDDAHSFEIQEIYFGDVNHPDIDSAGYQPSAVSIVRTQTYTINVPLISAGAK
ncbi:MAG TPA: hypothetical protein V6D47_21190 [Oscillatoriaceae cyanobacterium]